MSAMSDLYIQIREALFEGMSPLEVCDALDVPMEYVEVVLADLKHYEDNVDESMDGDAETALASAGWGTDEDYGDFGDY